MRRLIPIALMLAVGACGSSSPASPTASGARVLYVSATGNDGNAGTIAAPWQTLKHAVGQLHAGDTLYLRGGTYTEAIDSNTQPLPTGTSWANAPLIAAYSGETVVITGRLNLAASYLQYMIFDGLIFDGGGVSILGQGPPASGAHHIRIQNGEVKNHHSANGDGQGIFGLFGANHIELINLKIHDNGDTRLEHGVYLAIPDLLLERCEFYNNSGFGIQLYDSSGSVSDNAVVRDNRVHDNRGDGGVILSHGTNIQFYNNTVYDNLNGVGVNYKVIDTKIYNNTVYNNVGIGIEIQSGSVSANVQNNTVYANGTNIIDVGLATVLSHNGPH